MDVPHGVDALALVRQYEPVIRYTAGELFFPMPVERYLAEAALWSVNPPITSDQTSSPTLLADHGELDVDRLTEREDSTPGARRQLRYVPGPLEPAAARRWRRSPERPRFRPASRLAAVGLLGRLIDALFRLSLLLRGRVPGGWVAAAHDRYRATEDGTRPYYAHVSCDGGYVVVQYWFFYAMNDWRSTYAGVNDHEADWEQVTIYLTQSPPGVLAPAWVAFSSHDEVGADLRRRADDPDITWYDGTHPVVYAGAGSHSGAYLAGEYLVRVEPPALTRVFRAVTRIRELLFPWTRGRPRSGLAIPYVDYKRGDGFSIGPGTEHPWTAQLIDDCTPWVRDYTGLWGLDTADPFGGERAPAGPRYNRDGSIREAWADPVAWAGLDEVPPTPVEGADDRAARIAALEHRRNQLDRRIADAQQELRRVAIGKPHPGPPETELRQHRERVRDLRAERRATIAEGDRLRRLPDHGAAIHPHAHLSRRALPDLGLRANPILLVRLWTHASLSVLLAVVGIALLLNLAAAPLAAVAAILLVMSVEAVLRGRLAVFLLGALIVAGLVVGFWMFLTNWRIGLGVLALGAAIALAVADVRAMLLRR